MPAKNHRNQVVILTGGNDGIGHGMVSTLLMQGYRVAVLDICIDRLTVLAQRHPERFLFFRCDVRDASAAKAAVDEVAQAWGTVDVLVNNACRAVFAEFTDRTAQDIRDEFEVDYFGYLNTITAVLPHMRRQHRGIIQNMSSGVGLTGLPRMVGYVSAKGAIEAMSRTLRLELAPLGIAVTVMHPPLTNTKSSAGLGIPGEMLKNPTEVGQRLAQHILSTAKCITNDWFSRAGLMLMRCFPFRMAGLLAGLTEKARRQAAVKAPQ